jgi:hypothetical protein
VLNIINQVNNLRGRDEQHLQLPGSASGDIHGAEETVPEGEGDGARIPIK